MALVNHKIKVYYKYYPRTRKELIECINKELDNGNTNLNCIDTSEIDDMWRLFFQNIATNSCKLSRDQQENIDISNWNTSKVVNMSRMFAGCDYFNCDISEWDISNVESMDKTFFGCKRFNQNLDNWKPNNIIVSHQTFKNSGLEGNEPSWYEDK